MEFQKPIWNNPLNGHLDPRKRRHLVQFYEDSRFLTDRVSEFAAEGIRKGQGVIIIATSNHIEMIRSSLRTRGIDVHIALHNDQLTMLDAAKTLESLSSDGFPNGDLFRQTVGSLMRDRCSRFPSVRAYGEMVNLLWETRKLSATLELENLWNELAKDFEFTLLCGYKMSEFESTNCSKAFSAICGSHTNVIPSDEFTSLESPEVQRRMIASLQQKVRELEFQLQERDKLAAGIVRRLYRQIRLFS
jgi:hypothetical protein